MFDIFTEDRSADWLMDMDKRINFAIDQGSSLKLIKPGNTLVVVTGWRSGSGYTNTMRIIRVPDSEKKNKSIPILTAEGEKRPTFE